jgi:hypothetical protein
MSDQYSEDIFNVGASVMGSIVNDSNNTISLITGDAIIKETTSRNTQCWQQFGFASRPALAAPGLGSAQTINIIRPNGDLAIAGRDLRDQAIYGNLSHGDTCVYGTGATGLGQARVYVNGNNGSITLYTTTDAPDGGLANTDSGVGVYFKISPQGMTFKSPFGNMTFDASGFHVQTITGAAIDLANVNLPAPIGGFNSARITASSIILDAPNVCLGPSPTAGGVLGYMPAVFGILPPAAPLIPILGVGVGAVTVAAASSTKIFISP